jgi:hypothetical protein
MLASGSGQPSGLVRHDDIGAAKTAGTTRREKAIMADETAINFFIQKLLKLNFYYYGFIVIRIAGIVK